MHARTGSPAASGGILRDRRTLALAGFVACAGLIGFALYLEHFKGLDPCPLCMIQRVCFIAMGGVFLIAALAGPRGRAATVLGGLAALLGLCGIGFAARHVWLQWYPPAMESCTADLFTQLQRLPFGSVIQRALYATGDCARIDWTLLGLSIAQWSFVWFVVLTGVALAIVRRPSRRVSRF